MQRLPPLESVKNDLRRDPIQTVAGTPSFKITYKGQTTDVFPQAEYQLWGMVVSHNDPFVWYTFDIAHDESSLDTRDFCVIWGDNIWKADYHNVHVHNDDNFCITRWRSGTHGFVNEKLSNNHLITNDEAIRKRISEVQIGDQIYLRGKLVNYSEDRWSGGVRRSSLNRTDTGNGACEVLFVEELRILSSYNRLWAMAHHYSLYGIGGALVMMLVLFFLAPTPKEVAEKKRNLKREAFFASADSLRWEPLYADAQRYAGFWRRLAAYIIDVIIIAVFSLAWIAFTVHVLRPWLSDSPELALTAVKAVPGLAVMLYFVILPATAWQGTVGKRLLRIRITTVHKEPIGVFRSLWRYISLMVVSPLLVAFIGLMLWIAAMKLFSLSVAPSKTILTICALFFAAWPCLMAAFTTQKRALHDYLAGTLVVRG